jgi:toxin ParE1/3/4
MATYNLSPEAVEDLADIWWYVARDSIDAADRLQHLIYAKFDLLAEFPPIGFARPGLGENLRKFPVKNYIIYYAPTEIGIRVVRVLHVARNIKAVFRGEEF